jgi:hypothetical protein
MPFVRYMEQVFMYNAYVKGGSARKVRRTSQHKILDVTVLHRVTVCRIVTK